MIINLLLFFIYSVIGQFYEALTILVYENKLDLNRGFLMGPYIPIYGVGAMFILEIGKLSNNIIIIFLLSFIICMITEYVTSYVMEKLFNARWWDYSNLKYNLNGRVELGRLLSFGLMGVIIIMIINPIVLNILGMIPIPILNIISFLIVFIMLIDFIFSSYVSFGISKNINKLSLNDKTIYFRNEIKNKLFEIIKSI